MRLPSRVTMPDTGFFRFGYAAPAAAGSTQATATALTSQYNAVTAADGTKGVALPDAVLGRSVFVLNTVTTAGLKVYGKVSGSATINGGTADASVTLGPGAAAWFIATSTTTWVVADAMLNPVNLSGLLATAAELNRSADLTGRVVSLTATAAITEVLHEGRTCLITGTGAAATFTLPAAVGSGGRYRFVIGQVNTSGTLFKASAGSMLFKGKILGASTTDSATDAARTWTPGATDDTVTFNGTTTGGVAIGDWVEFQDLSATHWQVNGVITQSGSEATPFSDTVA